MKKSVWLLVVCFVFIVLLIGVVRSNEEDENKGFLYSLVRGPLNWFINMVGIGGGGLPGDGYDTIEDSKDDPIAEDTIEEDSVIEDEEECRVELYIRCVCKPADEWESLSTMRPQNILDFLLEIIYNLFSKIFFLSVESEDEMVSDTEICYRVRYGEDICTMPYTKFSEVIGDCTDVTECEKKVCHEVKLVNGNCEYTPFTGIDLGYCDDENPYTLPQYRCEEGECKIAICNKPSDCPNLIEEYMPFCDGRNDIVKRGKNIILCEKTNYNENKKACIITREDSEIFEDCKETGKICSLNKCIDKKECDESEKDRHCEGDKICEAFSCVEKECKYDSECEEYDFWDLKCMGLEGKTAYIAMSKYGCDENKGICVKKSEEIKEEDCPKECDFGECVDCNWNYQCDPNQICARGGENYGKCIEKECENDEICESYNVDNRYCGEGDKKNNIYVDSYEYFCDKKGGEEKGECVRTKSSSERDCEESGLICRHAKCSPCKEGMNQCSEGKVCKSGICVEKQSD